MVVRGMVVAEADTPKSNTSIKSCAFSFKVGSPTYTVTNLIF